MFKKTLILILAIIMILPAVSAFTVHINPANESSHKIYYDEVAEYVVTIENTESRDTVYSININPVEWVLESQSSFIVPMGGTESAPMNIKPRPSNFQGVGTHYIPVTIKTNYGEEYTTQVPLYVKSFKEGYGEYMPAISLGVSMRAEINPEDGAKVEIMIRNRNILDIKGMEIVLQGDDFSKTETIDLDGLMEQSLNYYFDIDPATEPGVNSLKVYAKYQGKILSEARDIYEIVPYSTISRDKTESTSWFKKTKLTVLTNNGNVEKEVDIQLDTPWYVWPFTDVEIEANLVEESDKGWLITLDPLEKSNVYVYENYRYIMGFLFLVVLSLIAYFVFRSPVVIHKQIVVTGKDAEGISEMKVRIFVRNRTANAYYNLRLIDKAPSIAEVLSSNSLGVLQPNKIIPTEKRGTIVKWDVESLEAYEERIFTYTLKARLKIIGNLSLPGVKAKFENVKGNERTVQSARAVIGAKV